MHLALASPPDTDVPAPDFELTDLGGKTVGLKQYKGKVVVLNFWGTWCAPCLKETPDLVAVQKQFVGQGLVVIGVAMDQSNQAGVQAFAKKYQVNYPIVITDNRLNHNYGVIVAPTTFIIDKNGNIVYRHLGALTRQELAQQITRLL
ncbi:MAG: TlpA disulfide reductase family protein [Methylovulum sp.]|uniref:TlpA family protein disulfide reductase n=1 Tax=Methylovulum sp. TaxID=1916980 RepID=UPI002616C331|nr:TlpA disulfide reductase family protein [Methylovulum sp.]MDD2724325.1 TlpA disulfide reductase family protein [Methylovulum sp.]MDD5124968.1 TlpA disulfide reductase family protein [Methylovulum sp.]